MRKALLWLCASALFSTPALFTETASAQATRTFVSGVGNDADPCSRTAPCRTFAGAIVKTFINGEINCLDPGGYGTVNITKSITIDCGWTHGSTLASGTTGVIINIPGNPNDPLRTVRLRGIAINGTGASGAVGTRTGIDGIRILSAAAVFIEDVLITDFSQSGIEDIRTGGGVLFIRNSVIRNNAGVGILSAGTGGTVGLSIENTHSLRNLFGVAAATGNNVSINRSVFSGNLSGGVHADSGAKITLNNSSVSFNALGISVAGGALVRLSNSEIVFNSTGINGSATSHGNNRIAENSVAGTAPVAAGGATSDLGQQ